MRKTISLDLTNQIFFFQDFNPPNRDFYAHNDSKKEYIMQKTHAYNVLIIHEMQTNMR